MIKNERQYRITRAHAERLRKSLTVADGGAGKGVAGAVGDISSEVIGEARAPYRTVHPLIAKAQEDALNSQLADLEGELTEYETLKSGEFDMDSLKPLADIPRLLIQARIARGLSQRELAERLGMKEQQIQQYEATEYASASLRRIREVAAVYEMAERG